MTISCGSSSRCADMPRGHSTQCWPTRLNGPRSSLKPSTRCATTPLSVFVPAWPKPSSRPSLSCRMRQYVDSSVCRPECLTGFLVCLPFESSSTTRSTMITTVSETFLSQRWTARVRVPSRLPRARSRWQRSPITKLARTQRSFSEDPSKRALQPQRSTRPTASAQATAQNVACCSGRPSTTSPRWCKRKLQSSHGARPLTNLLLTTSYSPIS